jgi:hypothetical protein
MVLLVIAGCAKSDATPNQEVAVELAAVTLADDCGLNPALPAPKIKADADEGKRAPDAKRKPGSDDLDCGGMGCGRGACEQTSIQLSIKATATAKPTTIKVKKVELLDDKGKLLETLTAKQPSRWNAKKYIAWNESVAAGETLATSYLVSSPNWNKLTNGRRNAHTKKFQVRVTLAVGTQSRTFEKQVTAPAMVEPDVDT